MKIDLSLLDVPVTRVLLNISDFHHVFMEGPIIQLQYLDFKPHQPGHILVKLEFGVLAFEERGKLENPEKNPRSKARTNNKLNPTSAAYIVIRCKQTIE